MKIVGKIKILKKINFKNIEHDKVEMILTTDETGSQDLLITFRENKCKLLEKFKVNDKVILTVSLRGVKHSNSIGKIEYSNEILCRDIINYNLNEIKAKSRLEKDREEDLSPLPF